MTLDRPSEIKAKHLSRKAFIYIRQSTEAQVEKNDGSTEYQRGQFALAIEWGWHRDQIEIVEDLGLSGTAADHRPGYKRMVQEVLNDQVGAIFVSDLSRGGRNSIEWFTLLESCKMCGTLLVNDGHVYDLSDANELFMTQLQALFAEHDNRIRRGHLERGRIAKVKAGKTVNQPPVGYLRRPDGSWIKDPDVAVQEGVQLVVRTFLEAKSLRRTVDRLNELRAQVPRRSTGHPVHWKPPQIHAIQHIITNPNYTGDYVWGRRRSDLRRGRGPNGYARSRKATSEEIVVVRDHHEAYISRDEWNQITQILESNLWTGQKGGLGRGSALLQGMLRCRRHRSWRMMSHYKVKRADGCQAHGYHCAGGYFLGGACGTRPGRAIDAKIVDAALDRLAPPKIEALREVWRKVQSDAGSEERRRLAERRRAEQEVEDLETRYLAVDSGNRRVRVGLEGRLERAHARLEALNHEATSQPSKRALFDESTFDEALALAHDLPALWSASTTTDRDRKEILRALITTVYLEEFDEEKIDLTILWNDSFANTAVRVLLPRHAHRLIREWRAAGDDPATIAIRLERAGIRTKYGTHWTGDAVQRALYRMRSNVAED